MATTAAAATDRIGDLLVREGLITAEQLTGALADARSNNTRIGYSLIKLGFIAEADLTRMLARQYRVPAVDLERVNVDPKIIKLVPADLAHKHLVLPLRRVGRTLTLAMANPVDLAAIDALKFTTRHEIEPVVVGEYTLKNHLNRYYPEELKKAAEVEEADNNNLQGILDAIEGEEDVELIEEQDEEINVAAMQQAVEDAPVVKLINGILTDAVLKGASDIHIEPFEKEIRVRYRIDGALIEIMKPPMKMKAALTSRLKILSALNIAERRIPQDGRIKLKMKHKVVDFRVSTLPVIFGEKIVLRILDKGNLTFDLTNFGFEPKALSDFMAGIMNPYGMVLVTGPTGSGKTTTLYSALSKVNTIETNIMTAEDPVEYNIYGINQVLVRNEVGMTFSAALKAFLRQDPNIIMVGEIRDIETGGIAIKAALTGHLVLSTLHTNDTPSTITRLIDMGLEPFNVAAALNVLTAQRLLRRVCANCKEPASYEKTFLDAANMPPEYRNLQYFKGKGCETCNGSGYKGRCGVYEVLPMTTEMRRAVMRGASSDELRELAISEGMLTLRMDGLLKASRGTTTLEEVIKETAAV
ncbi:MAG TPA: type IV-A pilus assembly ATPase PilB [Longimicrobiales bacterium]|nr:type IV-A pilus assembly ATPase PilB [Longimicrobiales bacterium]